MYSDRDLGTEDPDPDLEAGYPNPDRRTRYLDLDLGTDGPDPDSGIGYPDSDLGTVS